MRFTLALFLALALGSATRARAEEPRLDPAQHLDRGAALFEHGDFAAALTEFEAAYQLSQSWKVLIHIGITQSRLVRYDEALATLQRYLKQGGDAVPTELRARAENEIKAIRALLARVTVTVAGGPARVEVDGKPVGPSPLKAPLTLSPGEHRLRATRPGHEPAERRVTLKPGAALEITLSPKRQTGILRVDSRPAGARVLLDGRDVGPAPWEQRLPAQGYDVEARLDGFRPASARVLLEARQTRELRLELEALPPPPPTPWYKKWYWWTAIGAVVVGGAVTAAVLVTRPRYDVSLTVPAK